jgi:hypothetical protein
MVILNTDIFRHELLLVGNVASNLSTHIHNVWNNENITVEVISDRLMKQNGGDPFPVSSKLIY